MIAFLSPNFGRLLLPLCLLIFVACNEGYKNKDGKVSFNGKEISNPNMIMLNEAFAKDSDTVYYKDHPLTNADVTSFKALDEHYGKDNHSVFYCDEYRQGQNYYMTKKSVVEKIAVADPGTFSATSSGYARDSRRAYFEGVPFIVKDISTLQTINRSFVCDESQAYFNRKPIKGSHGKSFQVVDDHYAKDAGNYYFYPSSSEDQDIYLMPSNPAYFTILDYPYSKDNNSVFFEQHKITGAVPLAFQILKNSFSRDNKSVYFRAKKIMSADPGSFTTFPENESFTSDYYFAKDSASVFWQDIKIAPAELSSFSVIGPGYGKDAKHVFYKDKIITNAQPASFTVFPHSMGDADAEDIHGRYKEGKKLPDE